MAFNTFEEFYPVYIAGHANMTCRKLHFIVTSTVIILIMGIFFTGNWMLLMAIPVAAYAFAWIGHFMFEKNVPLSFHHPLYSLLGDFRMFWEILTGKLQAF